MWVKDTRLIGGATQGGHAPLSAHAGGCGPSMRKATRLVFLLAVGEKRDGSAECEQRFVPKRFDRSDGGDASVL